MSADDEAISSSADAKRVSATSQKIPPDFAGVVHSSNNAVLDNSAPEDRNENPNTNTHVNSTAMEIANTDDKVRHVLHSDVPLSFVPVLIFSRSA